MKADILNLNDQAATLKFYEDRYGSGYMEEWPEDKKQRILEVVKSLNLPEKGEALDFGCGNGVFTSILKKALPAWNVYGLDISSVAVNNAKSRYPECIFFLPAAGQLRLGSFDFLFTHHVLEHAYDLPKAWQEINSYLKDKAGMLHILPCANNGSFEHRICLLQKNGIVESMGGKFFFEDTGHLRRLSTVQADDYAKEFGFSRVLDYYSNQFYGAIDWITLLSPGLILGMVNPGNVKNKFAALKLGYLCAGLMIIKLARFPANTIDYNKKRINPYKYYLFLILLFPLYPFSKLINICLRYLSSLEWKKSRGKKNGSEMYLYYARS